MSDADAYNQTPYNFGPASEGEKIVFGAARPAFGRSVITDADASEWLGFMKARKIKRICCLLSQDQIEGYGLDLPSIYKQALGQVRVCWSPISDGHLAAVEQLTGVILPFLDAAEKGGEKVVVHCSAGMGRTGFVLAAWLVHGRGLNPQEALEQVRLTGRNPTEAVEWGNVSIEDVQQLLQAIRR